MIEVRTNQSAATYSATARRRLNRWAKLGLDYALTIPTLILIAPLLVAIAILIKLDSPGPILYRHRVVGRRGREFDAYKFRTVYVNSTGKLLANRAQWVAALNGESDADPRLTRVGRFLRRFGLDELPRLFNVLNRSMSLVGPRMMTRGEMLRFGHRIEGYYNMLPGMTGLWQVSGHSRHLDDRVELETHYIRDWSFLLDLHILARSVEVAFITEA